jgi:glycolate oxidase iron-sulfur subunit
MQTHFTPAQLADPHLEEVNDIFRKCVHCGFCTATCPTFVLLGDETDSPRGRIYQVKNVLEEQRPVPPKVVLHLDRCLSCLSCMTTCPSGVNYMHFIDHARVHVEETHKRPLADRLLRALLAKVLPNPSLFRLALIGAKIGGPFAGLMPGRLKGMLGMAPKALPRPSTVDRPQVFAAEGTRKKRVALMTGCAQKVLRPGINEATVRLLTRHGCEVVVAAGSGCCGALVLHMGREAEALDAARANIAAWKKVEEDGGLDAIVINASGCGTTVKDYGFLLRQDPEWAEPAAHISAIIRDVTELMAELGLNEANIDEPPVVAYHSACSLQHGQQLRDPPKELLRAAGFEVREPAEGHICCGSAGTYNLLQPDLAGRLGERKVINLERLAADVIAAGNLGCMVQIAGGTNLPVVHTVELLDWATGGPKPPELDE